MVCLSYGGWILALGLFGSRFVDAVAQCTESELQNVTCNTGSMTFGTDAGTIWPAYGTVSYPSLDIIPPANCTGSRCWRANVTCTYTADKKLLGNYAWVWTWVPTVQYPRGDKNWWDDDSHTSCQQIALPSSPKSAIAGSGFVSPNGEECPTFYYEYFNKDKDELDVKNCPVNTLSADMMTATSTMVVYNYLNEQDDGYYTCRILENGTPSHICAARGEVYYASPKWNGWCWTGMVYCMGGGLTMLILLANFITGSDMKSDKLN